LVSIWDAVKNAEKGLVTGSPTASTTGAMRSGRPRTDIGSKDQESLIDLRSAHKILLIGGPTAAGKSRIALKLAQEIPCEIVNADSRQIYKNLSVGTSQPDRQELKQFPHHLYGFLEPTESFTAADYERLATKTIAEIISRGRLAVLVGGTGFYMKAVLRGVWPVAARNDELRMRLRKIQKRHHGQFLHKMLTRFDPLSAPDIAPPDTYRIIRALEIFFQTGVRRSELPRNQEERYQALRYYVDPGKEVLHQNIVMRTEAMLEQGWLDEVKLLIERYPHFEKLPAAKSLGYQEILRYLRGEVTLSECKEAVIIKTKQYAKRQLTWFRNQDQFQAVPSALPFHKIIESVLQWYRN
jgi:tRNA dimethylallyltransferase